MELKINQKKTVAFMALCSCGEYFSKRSRWQQHRNSCPVAAKDEGVLEWESAVIYDQPAASVKWEDIATMTSQDLLKNHLNNVINKTWNYAGRCESHKDEVMNAVLGLAGEAGECADQMKKAYFHTDKGINFHIDKLRYELGDVLFYWLKLADLFDQSLEEIVAANRDKLISRHPELGVVTERFGVEAIK